jgi:acetyl-CoA C-acetyltransferase
MDDVVILSGARTPLGNFGGALRDVSAVRLGGIAIAEAVRRAGIAPDQVDEVIMANSIAAGLGLNPARAALLDGGLPDAIPAYTMNKASGSGCKAVALGAQAIRAGDAEIVVAGGMENMSGAPYLVGRARWGYRMGDGPLVDSMIWDGLSCPTTNVRLGLYAESIADEMRITREDQDRFGLASHQKAVAAIRAGRFKQEIVPVPVPGRKGEVLFEVDEHPRADTSVEQLAKLKPSFKEAGTVTAGNASGIVDGAAALVLASARRAQALGLKPLARIVSYASAGVHPTRMGLGPVPACEKALAKAGLRLDQIDLIEFNEAYAAQALGALRLMQADPARVNVNGGAIALGHPIGACGARTQVTLVHALRERGARYGLNTLGIGGGQGVALIVERL